jgi:hypothetical protein
MKIPVGQRPSEDPPSAAATSSATGTVGATALPIITGLNPNQGPASGGNTVTITGTSLTGATTVKFGTTAATFTMVSNSQINAVAPARAAGTTQVTVTTSGGTSNGLTYTYAAAPTITTLSPSQGPTTGGSTVTITGTNLSGVTSVQFDGVSASFTSVSGTQINLVAPTHAAGAAPVTVTSAAGTSAPAVYFFVAVPSTASLSPDKGPTTGGNTVTITGSGLLGASQVRFGGTNATSTVVSDSQITATAPARTAGPALITVTTPGGTNSGILYNYVAAPAVTALSPNAGPTTGGNGVTITGSGLTFASAVRFGSTLASFAVFSDSQAIAIAPPGAAGTVQVTVTAPGGVSGGTAYTYVTPPMV